jgi:hypothetical protein
MNFGDLPGLYPPSKGVESITEGGVRVEQYLTHSDRVIMRMVIISLVLQLNVGPKPWEGCW